MAASPKVRTDSVRGAFGAIGSVTGTVLLQPSKSPASEWTLSQHGSELLASQTVAAFPEVVHRWYPRTGLPPPCERSYLISTSPAVRTGVTPFPLSVLDWLNSKSMFV